jgi:ubiquinone/menaquinone biosynthesis C-methylase UbiE
VSDDRVVDHFGAIARAYQEVRAPAELHGVGIPELVEAGDLRGRRILDVGCGPGHVLAQLAREYEARCWGLDAAPGMIAVAREHVPAGVDVRVAEAESLPFEDAFFERVLMLLVVHHVDRPRAFREAARVLVADGRIAIRTPAPDRLESHWLTGIFPSYVEIDRARFPTAEQLGGELEAAGFAAPSSRRYVIDRQFSREEALRRIRERLGSTFLLLPEDEYRAGLERAERELPDRVEYELTMLLVTAVRP